MKKRSTKFWLHIAVFAGFTALSMAYVLLDYKWPVGTDVVYYINANTAQVTGEENAVKNAADSWNQIYPAGLRLSYGGSTGVITESNNSMNTVCWEDQGYNNGILATAWIWYSGSTILETDMVFNDHYNWTTSGSNYDIETVALHEFGHWIGLDHTSTGIMRPAYSGVERNIDSDAEAGFNALYGGEENPSIALDRTSLSFTGDQQRIFNVRNSGEGTLDYQISDNRAWISVSPGNGSSTGEWDEITVSVDTSGLGAGSYSGTVSVTSGSADNSPQNLAVYLTIVDAPPSVSITSPQNGAFVSGTIAIRADASDDNGVKKVEFYVGNELVATNTTSPYEWSWDTTAYPSGTHTVKAKAYDTIEQTAEDSIEVTVDQPPEVSISTPSSGSYVSGEVTVQASASDDVGIKKVEFYVGNELTATDTSSPYEWSWDTTVYSSGAHAVKVKAYDTIEQTAEDSIEVTVDQPPEVSITEPPSGSYVSGEVTVQASASDDVGISKVEFYINGVLENTDTESPYSYNWNTNSVFNGAYSVEAVVYDTINQADKDRIDVIRIPHAPSNFSGTKHNNSSTLLEQFINVLTWQANEMNRDIEKYRIYQKDGEEIVLLVELEADIFEYWHMNVEKDKKYTYILKAVDSDNREGEFADVEIQ
ncbi:MAG: matrixin family metalloprotease [Candidatus Aminicenantes bacterium]|nr:MAG: matrixin family metalloprotease [Candidatus Aminicenantes bacterium]